MSYQQVNIFFMSKLHLVVSFVFQSAVVILLLMNMAIGMSQNEVDQGHHWTQNHEFHVEIGTDTHYIDQGRDQLDEGGIIWGNISMDLGMFNFHSSLGRATKQDYTEWNLGMDVELPTLLGLDAIVGIQTVEIFGSDRESDIELTAIMIYSSIEWFVPSIEYTYSLDSHGHYVEVSLQGKSLTLNNGLSFTPYVTQAFDYEFVVDDYNGLNHFQMGVQTHYSVNKHIYLSGHVSHITPQNRTKPQINTEFNQFNTNTKTNINTKIKPSSNTTEADIMSKQLFAGIYFGWYF